MMGKASGHCYSSDRVRSPSCYQYGRSPFALPLVPCRIPLAGVGVNSATHHPVSLHPQASGEPEQRPQSHGQQHPWRIWYCRDRSMRPRQYQMRPLRRHSRHPHCQRAGLDIA
jgi:hypothetical protein